MSRRTRFTAQFAGLLVCACFSLHAQSRLVVVSQKDHIAHIFDPATNKQVAAVVEDGVTGHEAVISPDGKTLYVPIYGDSGVGKPGTNGDHIDVIDIASAKQTGRIDFSHGVRPHMIVWDTHTGMLLVTTELDKTVSIIDPRTLKIVGTIPTGQEQSHTFALSPDGKRGYTANVGPGTVSVLDIANRKLLGTVPVSTNTQRISVSRDSRYAFTSDQTKPELVVIDTASMKVARRIPMPSPGYGTAPTMDGKYLLVAMREVDKMAVIDLATMQVARTIDVPRQVYEIVLDPRGGRAWASCAASNELIAIDLNTFTVTAHMPAGNYPDGLAFYAPGKQPQVSH
ncbi:cytochrome D1 domain-containing protein [Terriglobus sp.]|uniref:cytochrome D1 domain-containing protein n=1 Tax=Terriglobus sp. TaxID=1889013 RepID=UPI003B00BE32